MLRQVAFNQLFGFSGNLIHEKLYRRPYSHGLKKHSFIESSGPQSFLFPVT